jgi:adenylate cyclase
MNSSTRLFSPLYAEISGSKALFERLNEAEAMQAFERCFNRLERAASSFNGRVVKHIGEQVLVVFDHAEDAMRAACEMQLRVEKLPAVSGIKLAVGIGFHYGPAQADNHNDSSGDAVKLAARLMQLAKGGQVVASAAAVEALPDSLRKATLALDNATVKLHHESFPVYVVVWQTVASQTGREETGSMLTSQPPASVSRPSGLSAAVPTVRLRLLHNNREYLLGAERPVVLLGRDTKSDVLIRNPHASRNHARIELRRNDFVLVDKSTNGTHVGPEGVPGFLLKGSEYVLKGRGCLSFGLLEDRDITDLVAYEVL